MREIKFRAWDDRRKRMMQPFVTFEKHPDYGLITENTNWHDDEDMEKGWDTSNQVNVLMQFTGLKDKNGKEIYEGDILNCAGDRKERYVIIWDKSGWKSKSLHATQRPISAHQHIHREVYIGNIYENPELLKP